MTMTISNKVGTQPRSSILPMIIIGVLFFTFGFFTWLNGSLIPFLKIICQLNNFQASFVAFAFYIAYTVMALPMSFILRRTGYKNGMVLGLGIMVVGSLLFIPAAQSTDYMAFLVALFVLGTGLTILQTASNPYLVHLGPHKSAAKRISIMALLNKVAGVVVPPLFTLVVLSGFENLSSEHLAAISAVERQVQVAELSSRLILPSIVMAGALLFVAALVKFAPLPELVFEDKDVVQGDKTGILQFPPVVLGAVALFAYVGVEVIAGSTIGLFGENLGLSNFASLTSYTMVFMVFGYLIGIISIPRFMSQQTALMLSAIAGILCIIGAATASTERTLIADLLWGWSGIPVIPDAVTFVAMMGLAHAMVWPSIWPLAIKGLGKRTAQGSALLIMGISGGAILPLAFGKIAYYSGSTQLAYWIGLPCYLFILFFAMKGHKMRKWSLPAFQL
ncbi:MAG: sugar MFS transporter [Shewanella sp.]|nr:sugar MFS transporter [Shewanella sp.]